MCDTQVHSRCLPVEHNVSSTAPKTYQRLVAASVGPALVRSDPGDFVINPLTENYTKLGPTSWRKNDRVGVAQGGGSPQPNIPGRPSASHGYRRPLGSLSYDRKVRTTSSN